MEPNQSTQNNQNPTKSKLTITLICIIVVLALGGYYLLFSNLQKTKDELGSANVQLNVKEKSIQDLEETLKERKTSTYLPMLLISTIKLIKRTLRPKAQRLEIYMKLNSVNQ